MSSTGGLEDNAGPPRVPRARADAADGGRPSASVMRLESLRGRWVMVAAVAAGAKPILDLTAVNVVLPAIGADTGASLAQLQWVVNARCRSRRCCCAVARSPTAVDAAE